MLATELKSLVGTKHAFLKPDEELSLMAHSYVPALEKQRQEDREVEASLGCVLR